MNGNVYEIDTEIQLNGTFVNAVTGALADPTGVTLYIEDPSGNITDQVFPGNIIKVSTGVYYYQFTPSEPGTWTYKWQGQGNVIATSPDKNFFVRASNLISE